MDHHLRGSSSAGFVAITHTGAGRARSGGPATLVGCSLGGSCCGRISASTDPRRVPVWHALRGSAPFHGTIAGRARQCGSLRLHRCGRPPTGVRLRRAWLIELSGAPVARIVAAGGGAVQPWMQAIGRPVEVSGWPKGGTGSGFPRPLGGRIGIVDRRRCLVNNRLHCRNPVPTGRDPTGTSPVPGAQRLEIGLTVDQDA